MTFDLCPSPALYPFYKQDRDTVIVVDIFRASTTMCRMLHNGATAVIPVADIEEAKQYKKMGYLVGAERHTRKCDFADCGNSPFDYTPARVKGKEVVFTTTNGTMAIKQGADARKLLIGCFSNLDALAHYCIKEGERVVLLCAGWNNRLNLEDTLYGGALLERLLSKGNVEVGSDAARLGQLLWKEAESNPLEFLKKSDHYPRLIANHAESDAAYCLESNTVSLVPYLDKGSGKIVPIE